MFQGWFRDDISTAGTASPIEAPEHVSGVNNQVRFSQQSLIIRHLRPTELDKVRDVESGRFLHVITVPLARNAVHHNFRTF
jgi:hypothetical protein